MNYNKNDKYEFYFTFEDNIPFYTTYHKPHIDEELLLFLIDIGFDFNKLTGFKVSKLIK
tara:strand:- start:229 stop:405 length:177 start_codon:yes stop_codon:yes gene_type:complete